ncbi:hypothetical protein T10_13049 [Trichinella papuae]|uniref:Uncharacterized protein n=1 Tax=Trichinella papuae TaxID=268474 RepID=A0A0V1MGW1_9BILA|nr:hypothetical protein T10_13049 [Trichinella papuae]
MCVSGELTPVTEFAIPNYLAHNWIELENHQPDGSQRILVPLAGMPELRSYSTEMKLETAKRRLFLE